jgi:hypothetical protein
MTHQITLSQPATYKIKVPGHLAESCLDSFENMQVSIETETDCKPVTVLTCDLDQAALIGLLRRLYSMGLPLISVVWID